MKTSEIRKIIKEMKKSQNEGILGKRKINRN
jgi:hypothetical protein